MPAGFVYILASQRNGKLYIGVTRDLLRRIEQHRTGHGSEFARKHSVYHLVYFERHTDIRDAIAREKLLKGWRRAWKIDLIEKDNSGWNDLIGRVEPGIL